MKLWILSEKFCFKFIPDKGCPDPDPKWFIPDSYPTPDPTKSFGSDSGSTTLFKGTLFHSSVDGGNWPEVGQAVQPYCLGKGEMTRPRRKPMQMQINRACQAWDSVFFSLEYLGGCNKCYQSLCWPVLGIRNRMFLGLQDPDMVPLVRGTDPALAPDPSLFS